jgi:hypothetical protein
MLFPHSKDLGARIVREHAQAFDLEVERRLVRKIDLIQTPFMWIGYGRLQDLSNREGC